MKFGLLLLFGGKVEVIMFWILVVCRIFVLIFWMMVSDFSVDMLLCVEIIIIVWFGFLLMKNLMLVGLEVKLVKM